MKFSHTFRGEKEPPHMYDHQGVLICLRNPEMVLADGAARPTHQRE